VCQCKRRLLSKAERQTNLTLQNGPAPKGSPSSSAVFQVSPKSLRWKRMVTISYGPAHSNTLSFWLERTSKSHWMSSSSKIVRNGPAGSDWSKKSRRDLGRLGEVSCVGRIVAAECDRYQECTTDLRLNDLAELLLL
jgi:hypothetical protein